MQSCKTTTKKIGKAKSRNNFKSHTKTFDERRPAPSTLSKKNPLADRASEALEKLTNAYRAVTVPILEALVFIQKPTKIAYNALRLFTLFINAFRDIQDKWPRQYLNNWPNLVNYVAHSPSSKELCLELQKLKKIVTRPHLATISEETYQELHRIREEFLDGRDQKFVMRYYSNCKEMKVLAEVVLTSINHLMPDLDVKSSVPDDDSIWQANG